MSQLLNEAEQEVNSARLDTRDNVKDPLDFEHDQAFLKGCENIISLIQKYEPLELTESQRDIYSAMKNERDNNTKNLIDMKTATLASIFNEINGWADGDFNTNYASDMIPALKRFINDVN